MLYYLHNNERRNLFFLEQDVKNDKHYCDGEQTMKVYGYIRVSTNNQVENGLSLKDQERQIKCYAGSKDMSIDRVMTERGVSASVDLYERPVGKKLLELVKDGDVIICSKLDRMFRSCLDGLQVLKELKERKVELHFIDLGGNTTTNGIGTLMFTLMSAFAEMERNRLGERIRGTKRLQMKEDVYTGGPVGFGYVLEQHGEKRYLVENEEQQKIIKRMKVMRKDGMSYRKISEILEKEKIEISHQGISNILKDEETKKLKTRRVNERIKKTKKGV